MPKTDKTLILLILFNRCRIYCFNSFYLPYRLHKALFTVFDIDMPDIVLSRFSFINLKIERFDQRSQFCKSEISWIKVRLFFQDKVADITQICPSVFISKVGY